MRAMRRTGVVLFLVFTFLVFTVSMVPAQEPTGGGPSFGMDLALGVVSFVDEEDGETLTYQQIGFRPHMEIGRFGLGLDLGLNYRFTGGDGSEFEVREEDWIPSGEVSFLELYLPKIEYLRYGRKGDSLYAQFGSLSNTSLGNGFIMENYTNRLFRPGRPIFGGVVDVDGTLVGVPQIGLETMVANVAAWDVMGVRFYTRPLVGMALPVLPRLQIGSTLVVDRDPYYHIRKNETPAYEAVFEDVDTSSPDDPVIVWGLDTRLPLLMSDFLRLDVFGDLVWQEDRLGGMVGTGGRLAGFLLYGAQIRAYQDNFVPTYFGGTYDRRRVERYLIYTEEVEVDGTIGWLGRLGVSLWSDSLVFLTQLSGPFETGTGVRPELQSTLTLAEGTVPGFAGFSFDARYEKFNLKNLEDLVSAEDAIIGARFNIRSGPVIVRLSYNLMYDPLAEGDPWIVTSGLETAISF